MNQLTGVIMGYALTALLFAPALWAIVETLKEGIVIRVITWACVAGLLISMFSAAIQ